MKFRQWIEEGTNKEELLKKYDRLVANIIGLHHGGGGVRPMLRLMDAIADTKKEIWKAGIKLDIAKTIRTKAGNVDVRKGKINESVSRFAEIFKAKNKKWYLNLADKEYGDYHDSTTYGPFDSEEEAEEELHNHANPGALYTDNKGKRPVPKKSPNGRPIQKPRRGYY